MALIDGGNIGGAESCDDAEKLVAEINRQGNQILGKRSLMLDPSEILKHVTQKQQAEELENIIVKTEFDAVFDPEKLQGVIKNWIGQMI